MSFLPRREWQVMSQEILALNSVHFLKFNIPVHENGPLFTFKNIERPQFAYVSVQIWEFEILQNYFMYSMYSYSRGIKFDF